MAHPFIPVPNTALIEMVFLCETQIIENTFHVQKSSPFTAGQLLAMCQTTFDGWDNLGGGKSLRGNVSNLTQIKGRALDTIASPVAAYVLVTPRPGTGTGNQLPNNVTFCWTWQTGLAGRSQRGRLYAPGMSSGQITTNTSDAVAGFANGGVTALNQLVASVAAVAGGNQLVVTSYRNGGAWRTTGQNTVIINSAYHDLHLDSQRRRLPGRGS